MDVNITAYQYVVTLQDRLTNKTAFKILATFV